jgi:hypothetical protein
MAVRTEGKKRPLIHRMVAIPLDYRSPASQIVVGEGATTALALMTPPVTPHPTRYLRDIRRQTDSLAVPGSRETG